MIKQIIALVVLLFMLPMAQALTTDITRDQYLDDYYSLLLGSSSTEELVYAMGFEPNRVQFYGFVDNDDRSALVRKVDRFYELDRQVRGHTFVVVPEGVYIRDR